MPRPNDVLDEKAETGKRFERSHQLGADGPYQTQLHVALARSLLQAGKHPRTVQLAPGVHQILIFEENNSVVELTIREGDPTQIEIRAGRQNQRADPVSILMGSTRDSELMDRVFAVLKNLQERSQNQHTVTTPIPPSELERFEWFGGDDTPPPFTIFLCLGPTISPSEIAYVLHALLELNLFFGHLGFGLDTLIPVLSPEVTRDDLRSRFVPFIMGIGPRFRLGAKSSLFSLDLGTSVGGIIGITLSSTKPITEQASTDETSSKSHITGGIWSSITASVRLAQDFYIRFGLWLGSSFVAIEVSNPDERLTNWGQPFGSLLLGAEARVP